MERLLQEKPQLLFLKMLKKKYYNDIIKNEDNLVKTGILEIGKLKDNRKYESTTQVKITTFFN